ncbi:2-oxo-4-hydroxy-4-carboxy-5-ureidoimidazoline decarboxylase-like isoform X2 [Pecten maximus]|uniref:2-oxo-4-hydroxy-4-carboxy-5-ureidoimidazoline decarboxylase-like isoform X1 n=1 Tax=Pecten maximus TaxID=6579 RepID=UPI001458B841|nr:2-oxo-4-hydroxy-4-carboxy-5-ureidoimidazoline decarboxylase-like isoform X1 [Pecten maximus]XP_033742754.1 2-oxo-4-hydroxy-4-carboxy-5-ureidoimidazoline decarboxylase-like isoform X2 [Pecten maximus]
MSEKTLLSVHDVNQLTSDDFIDVFGNVVEHCSLCAAAVWQHRPFTDVHHIHKLVCDFLDNIPYDGKQGVLRLHPDLAGKVAGLGGLTVESQNEQKAAGIDSLTPAEKETIRERNKSYRNKFGFPFVICARKNKKEAILGGLKLRLQNDITEEVLNGVEQVKLIALLRLLSIVEE